MVIYNMISEKRSSYVRIFSPSIYPQFQLNITHFKLYLLNESFSREDSHSKIMWIMPFFASNSLKNVTN